MLIGASEYSDIKLDHKWTSLGHIDGVSDWIDLPGNISTGCSLVLPMALVAMLTHEYTVSYKVFFA